MAGASWALRLVRADAAQPNAREVAARSRTPRCRTLAEGPPSEGAAALAQLRLLVKPPPKALLLLLRRQRRTRLL